VRRKDIGAGKTSQTQLPERDKRGQEALIASKEFCDTPYLLVVILSFPGLETGTN
jgi:hypothetical protein